MFKKILGKDKQDQPSDPEQDTEKSNPEKKGLFGRKKDKQDQPSDPDKDTEKSNPEQRGLFGRKKDKNTTIKKPPQSVNTKAQKPPQQDNQDFKIDFNPNYHTSQPISSVSSQPEAQDDVNQQKGSFQTRRYNVLTQKPEQSGSIRQNFYKKNISEVQLDDDDEPDIFRVLDQQTRQTIGLSRPSIQEEVKNETEGQIAQGNSFDVESAVKMSEVVDSSERPEIGNKDITSLYSQMDTDKDRDYFDNEVKVREPSKSTVKIDRRQQVTQNNPFFEEMNREENQIAIDSVLILSRNKTSESMVRRQALFAPTFQDELQEKFDSAQNTSEDFLSEKSSDCDSLSLGDFEGSKKLQDVFQRRQQVEGEFKIHNFLEEIVEKHKTDPTENVIKSAKTDDLEKTVDTIKLVDTYEKQQVELAEEKRQELKQKAIQCSIKKKAVLKSVFSTARKMNYKRAAGMIETCVALTDHLVLVGTQNGTLYCFERDTDELVTIYNESGKDYKNNPITCIDVHPKRQEFVVLGFQGGQVTLVNIESKKNIKQIEKTHKGSPIVTVKFCDWVREHPRWEAAIKSGEDINLQTYENAFMFISIASDGKVVVNDVSKVGPLLYADDTTLIDIKNWGKPKCEVLASKFYSLEHPQGRDNDLHSTLIAVANLNELLIFQIVKEGKAIKEQILSWSRPEFYPSESALGNFVMPDKLPIISWGYGKTPILKDKAYIILAVAWGPLIQLIVVDQNKKTNIIFDGYYFIPQNASSDQDAHILSLQFLDESVLLVTTSNQEMRVLYTQKFHYSKYEGKAVSDFSKLSSLQYVASRGKQLTDEQKAVELQLVTQMDETPQQSLFGSTQAIGVVSQHIVYLTLAEVFVAKHLSGDDFLASVDQKFESEGESFFYTLEKVFEVYKGSIRGLRGLNSDSKKDAIKLDLKQRILLELLKFGKINQVEYPLLVRRCIDFCLENNETNFLFEMLFPVFKAQQKGQIFVEEILNPILIGKFKDCCIPEEILSNHIMHYHQQRESGVFERMLMNLRFDHLSEGYKSFILDTCQQLRFASSLIYVCLSAYGESGALISLRRLQDLYQEPDKFVGLQQLQKLLSTTDDLREKATLERSSTYIGLKLMWLVRSYLLGNKFPKGYFKHNEFRTICCDVADLITQKNFMDTMFQIDYSAFFQILTIIFNVGSTTHTFISEQQKTTSHDAIVSRVTEYCFSLPPENPIRLHFLCFIASICDSYTNKSQSQEFYFTVAVELMHHNIEMLSFNKSRIEIQMENNQFYRKLSKVGIKGPDNLKHVQLSEENLLKVVKTVESLGPLPKEMIDKLILAAEETTFERLQLFLYDLNHDYLKCLKLLIASVNLQTESSKVKKGFNWITEKHRCLKSRVQDQNEESKDSYELKCFEREVLNQAETLVTLDPGKAVQMCEVMFEQKHLQMINRLLNKEYLQHWYIKELIRLKEADIREQMAGYSQAVNTSEAQQYKQILNLQVRLMCKLEPDNVVSEAKKIKKLGFYPIESLLVTYEEFNQLEACAILGNKMGLYQNSVEIYLKLLVENVKIMELRKELFKVCELVKKIENKQQLKRWELEEASGVPQSKLPMWEKEKSQPTFMDEFSLMFQKAQWIKKYAPNIQFFDRMMSSIQKLCRKHPEPVLQDNDKIWRKVLETVLKMSNEASVKKKRFCKTYFRDKSVGFSKVLLDYVKLDQIIAAMVQHKPNARFKAIESLVHEIFIIKQGEIAMCNYARQIIVKDLAIQVEENLNRFQQGVLSSSVSDGVPCCDLCKGLLKNQAALFITSTQAIRVFDCSRNPLAQKNHSFHQRCLNKFFTEEATQLTKQSSQKLDSSQLKCKMRCPVCQVVSFEILPQPKYKPASRKNKLRDANLSSAEEDEQASQGLMRKTNKVAKKTKDIQKRLMAFDASLADEYLQSDDFFKTI